MSGSLRKKLIVVGDGAVGKTNLIIGFAKGEWPDVYTPTVFETTVKNITIDGKNVELTLWDTAGQEDYDRLRPLSYPKSSVIVICFAIDDPDSFYNVPDKWATEAKHYCPGVPIILAGLKTDLREDSVIIAKLGKVNEKPLSKQQGVEMATTIGATKYVECSAKTKTGLEEVFQCAGRAAMDYKAKKSGGCTLL
ncbi:transforming protein RhoA [Sphaeroforma arctica JP610]|uniref:Transforming protein RhoA n=1 Tax=Sphaeroforma arctica JP610 TaxID=667725 RepID=A0A0L0G7P7_9EUKA|nr:transforming protein RhoA [Sphaeroforma arctica JP610]KNC85057.1 transforming protein RhoA [Sphaeroforma arctica JP610]|eukprot:XP_014158959.1 transforming protein RhoA [Sphaeroforma arctica JP610]